jgi:CHASE2 domain-containing sensor protein
MAFTPDVDKVLRHVRDQGRQAVGLLGVPTLAARAAKLADTNITGFPPGGAWIDYAGGPGTYPRVSLVDVRSGRVPASRFKDKIVIVGRTSAAGQTNLLPDIHPTPANGGARMWGVEIHANAIATVRAGLPLREAAPGLAVLLIVALATVPAALAIRSRAAVALGLSLAAGVVFIGGAQLAFNAGWILPIIVALLALSLSAVASQGVIRVSQNTYARKSAAGL